MNLLPKLNLDEVTRLTRNGRLKDAMAVLRNGLMSRRSPSSGNEEQSTQTTSQNSDMQPSQGKKESGASFWTGEAAGTTTGQPVEASHLAKPLRALFTLGSSWREGVPLTDEPAPAPPLDGGRFEEYVYANVAGCLSYKLYIPSGYDGRTVPLVLMLHGCTQSPDDFAAGTRMNALAEELNFIVAYPAQNQSANASKCWNWFNVSDQQRDRGEPSLIAGITRQIMEDFAIEPRRVYIAGLSAGGAAAAVMGFTYPDLYAAVGVHSGLACGAARDITSAFMAMRRGRAPAPLKREQSPLTQITVPTIVFHGDRDTTVHPLNGDHVIAQSKATATLQITVSRGESPGGLNYTRIVHAEDGGRAVLEQWTIHGAGHAWAGGSEAGSYTDARGPDASRAMISFFFQQTLAVEVLQ